REQTSTKFPLQAWYADGDQISLFLLTHGAVSKPSRQQPLCPEDIGFIRKNDLQIHVSKSKSAVKPSILLRCDQLWALVREDKPHTELPSGLHLLLTSLGNLYTEKMKGSVQLYKLYPTSDQELKTLDQHWTLEGHVSNAFSQVSEIDEDKNVKWEQFWNLEYAETGTF
ncbi:hypothetical protein Angca_001887, partial [Angiostrongylus cantonensis]